MKPKTMILMVVAVSCGLGASYMTSRLLADREQHVEKVTILVAVKNLNTGDTIKDPDLLFRDKEFAKGDEPRTAIVDRAQLKGKVLKHTLRADDFVTPDDLWDEKGGGGVAYNLPAGHVAVGIRVNPEKIASGFASLPGSRVNVIWTVRRGSDRDSFTRTLLENVLVLAADTNTVRNEGAGAMPANVVTVALRPEDSMKLELAQSHGTVSLALRKFNEPGQSEQLGITFADLLKGNSNAGEGAVEAPGPALPQVSKEPPPPPVTTPLPPPPLAKKGPGSHDHLLTIIHGESVSQQRFQVPGVRGSDQPQPASEPKKKNNEDPDGN